MYPPNTGHTKETKPHTHGIGSVIHSHKPAYKDNKRVSTYDLPLRYVDDPPKAKGNACQR